MKIKNLFVFAVLVTMLAAFGAAAAQAANGGEIYGGQPNYKVDVCHIPPGNPDNWHIINVSINSVRAHMAHGDPDPEETSPDDPCVTFRDLEVVCDDYNACTIDVDDVTDECLLDHPPVDCDDSDPCTRESCDPNVGCQSAPIVCDDGDLCTVDMCNPRDGTCMGVPIDCGPFSECMPATGLCSDPCAGVTCDPISQCHEPGQCVLSAEGEPTCEDGYALAEGSPCSDGDEENGEEDQCSSEGECLCDGYPDCYEGDVGEPLY